MTFDEFPAEFLEYEAQKMTSEATEKIACSGSRQIFDRPAVLVVEDHPLLQAMYWQLLGADRRFKAVVVGSGGEAVAYARRHEPAAFVILDLNLPDLSGRELLRLLRAWPGYGRVPVAIASSMADEVVFDPFMSAETCAVLKKPFQPSELWALLDSYFPGRGGAPVA